MLLVKQCFYFLEVRVNKNKFGSLKSIPYICKNTYMEVKIYVLIDPITHKIRYIGRTKCSLNTRLNGHLSKSRFKKTHKDCWIQSLLKKGIIPKIKIFKKIIGWNESYQYEKNLISKCLNHGFDLVNSDDRGEGGVNKIITEDQKIKISNTLKQSYLTGKISPTNKTPVSIFDLEGNFIKSFESLTKCSLEFSIPYSSLEKVLAKRCKRWKSYQITYGDNPGKYHIEKNMSFLNKKINLLNINDNTITKFESYKSLAKFLETSTTQVRRYLLNEKIYKNNYRIQMPV